MTLPSEFDKPLDQMTGGGAYGDLSLSSAQDVRDYIASRMDELAIVVDSIGDLPDDATIRPNGLFIDLYDVAEYLETGGLVVPVQDENGKTTGWQPIGFVYVIATEREDGAIEYQIYIRDDSE
jgi:hypothetical protein